MCKYLSSGDVRKDSTALIWLFVSGGVMNCSLLWRGHIRSSCVSVGHSIMRCPKQEQKTYSLCLLVLLEANCTNSTAMLYCTAWPEGGEKGHLGSLIMFFLREWVFLYSSYLLIILNFIIVLIALSGCFLSCLYIYLLSKRATDTAGIVTVFPPRDNGIWQWWLNQSILGNLESLSAELE